MRKPRWRWLLRPESPGRCCCSSPWVVAGISNQKCWEVALLEGCVFHDFLWKLMSQKVEIPDANGEVKSFKRLQRLRSFQDLFFFANTDFKKDLPQKILELPQAKHNSYLMSSEDKSFQFWRRSHRLGSGFIESQRRLGGSFTNLSPVAFMVLAHLLYGNACAKGAGNDTFGLVVGCVSGFGKCRLVGSSFTENKNQFFLRLWEERVIYFFGQLSNAKWWQISGCLGVQLHFLWTRVMGEYTSSDQGRTVDLQWAHKMLWYSTHGQENISFPTPGISPLRSLAGCILPSRNIASYTTSLVEGQTLYAMLAWMVVVSKFFGAFNNRSRSEINVLSSTSLKIWCVPKMPNYFFLPKMPTKKRNNLKPNNSQSSNQPFFSNKLKWVVDPGSLGIFPKVVLVESCRSSTALLLPVTWHSWGVLNVS